MPIETFDDILDELADRLGVYGAHGDDEEGEYVQCKPQCRMCFTSELRDRIVNALDVEKALRGALKGEKGK